MSELIFKEIRSCDVHEVMEIERENPDPWNELELIEMLKKKHVVGVIIGWPADVGYRVLGFMLYEVKPCEIQVLNIAVKSQFKRQLIGTRFLNYLTTMGKAVHINVRESNLPAQNFLKQCGFRAISIVPNFYPDKESAYHFRKAPC